MLVAGFLEKTKEFQASVELLKVLRSRTYKIGEANVLVRSSSGITIGYFVGINYITLEKIANFENPFITFICGSVEKILIIPAKLFFKYIPHVTHLSFLRKQESVFSADSCFRRNDSGA